MEATFWGSSATKHFDYVPIRDSWTFQIISMRHKPRPNEYKLSIFRIKVKSRTSTPRTSQKRCHHIWQPHEIRLEFLVKYKREPNAITVFGKKFSINSLSSETLQMRPPLYRQNGTQAPRQLKEELATVL